MLKVNEEVKTEKLNCKYYNIFPVSHWFSLQKKVCL